MALRHISSLLLDELLSRLLARIRKRAAKNSLFSGIVVPMDDLIGRRVIATGLFEATQIDGVSQMLEHPELFGLKRKPNGIFIDIGANIGLFTIAFTRFFEHTLAIEANPKTFAILKTNITLRDLDNVHCLCIAASDTTKTSVLFVPRDGNLGHATMNPHQHQSSGTVKIDCRKLDDIVDERGGTSPVGLVKIDVEGHELEVLHGAQKTLLRDRPIVLFEALEKTQASKCASFLSDCGYYRFFSFQRGNTDKVVPKLLVGSVRGLDVHAHPMTVEDIRISPLICAIPDSRF
jgi:FkbM family methyltransferase